MMGDMSIEQVRRIKAGIQHAEEIAALSFEQGANMELLCDEVERVQARNDALRAALETIASFKPPEKPTLTSYLYAGKSEAEYYTDDGLWTAAIVAARALLADAGGEGESDV